MSQEPRAPHSPPQGGRPGITPKAPPPSGAKKQPAKGKKITNGLVALGTAAIISVYGVGYVHSNTAAATAAELPTIAIATTAPAATSTAAAPLLAPTTTIGTTSGIASAATATPAATAAPTATTAATSQYKDGTYTGTGASRHGNITATVVVQGGKIVSADITQCGTRYPCSKIAALPGEVVSRQSAAVDMVSGATDSSTAYQGAITNALAQAAA
jgi:uncharacterized protein with FMN-binding domain